MLSKYAINKQKGNIGEAFVQFFLSRFALVHKVDGGNDLGNDFFCELFLEEYPTNILFYVQVKLWCSEPRVKESTKDYWRKAQIPVYLFWVKCAGKEFDDIVLDDALDEASWVVKYKRMTAELHKEKAEGFEDFDLLKFKRDLMIDYARSMFIRGFTPVFDAGMFFTEKERSNLDLARFQNPARSLIKEDQYVETVLDESWSHFISVAHLLHRMYKELKKEEYLKGAEDCINLAETLYGISNVTDVDHVLAYLWSVKKEIRNSRNQLG
ncbi:DUF4365 domain-containing protein [Candidatus Dojkabacteria bacterium]|nr:DUF4365 domain-containing protein [Candidatus Dojkabacteria bacterium]